MLTAIETTGTINANQQIVLDEDLPSNAPSRVRVIVLFDDDADIRFCWHFDLSGGFSRLSAFRGF